MMPASPEALHWTPVVWARNAKCTFIVHRCIEEPRITWHFAQNHTGCGEKFAVDAIDMGNCWQPRDIEERLRVQQPHLVMTKEEQDLDAMMRWPAGHA